VSVNPKAVPKSERKPGNPALHDVTQLGDKTYINLTSYYRFILPFASTINQGEGFEKDGAWRSDFGWWGCWVKLVAVIV
jgi:hypothetical protein